MRHLARLIVAVLAVLALTATAAVAFDNGRLPRSALAPAAQGGCVQLAKPAAKAWNALQVRVGKVLPVSGCLSAYRTLSEQVAMRTSWCARGACSNAAVPGTSNHGLGIAVDVPAWVRTIVDRHGARYGWCKATQVAKGRSCWSDAAHEPWHIRWTAGIFKARRPNMPVLIEGSQDGAVRFLRQRIRAHARRPTCRVKSRPRRFGTELRMCVLNFQKRSSLAGDGNVGPATWKKLIAAPKAAR